MIVVRYVSYAVLPAADGSWRVKVAGENAEGLAVTLESRFRRKHDALVWGEAMIAMSRERGGLAKP